MTPEKQILLAIFFITTLMATAPLMAADDHHDHASHSHGITVAESDAVMPHESDMNGTFLKKRNIDGYDVTFHVMKAQPGKEMGGSHDFMIKVEKSGKVVPGISMNTKVVYPDGKSETKMAMKMGDWLMAGYDLGEDGKHQLMILFKTPAGKKHKGGVYYPQ